MVLEKRANIWLTNNNERCNIAFVVQDNKSSWRNGIRGRLRACAERRAGSSPVEDTYKWASEVQRKDAHSPVRQTHKGD